MKIVLKYEESDQQELNMTLRLTLPQKYVNGPSKDVIRLFVEHYNKKHAESPLDVDDLHVKVAGGNHLDRDERVCDAISAGDECYLLAGSAPAVVRTPCATSSSSSAVAAKSTAPCSTSTATSPSYTCEVAGKKADKDKDGKVRCKRFGCNKYFDPENPPKCVHHKAPPIFHETAKWWSCCPDRKAYDWDEFMRIPGCETGVCSANPDGQQGQKRFLGGQDLREQNAPIRLDANAPPDARTKLANLRKGLVAIGVNPELFDQVLGKTSADVSDAEQVVQAFKERFTALLSRPETL
mmetsp:Transcript_43518/g.100164  ORF Transcript_43518/g.100164 Transcript_43518/m.100164 type:complete len:295 (+) Transcript_43518:74-958(+)